jgi:class 3 adenylate cyclase
MTSQPPTDEGAPRRRFWDLRNTSVATRLALSVLAVSVTSLLVTAIVGIVGVQGSANNVLENRLESVRSAKAAEIETFFRRARGQASRMSHSEMLADGVTRFTAAFAALERSVPEAARRAQERRVGAFYLDEFIPRLEEVRGEGVTPLSVTVGNPAGITLQDLYIASSPLEIGEKDLLSDADDGSAWTRVHRELHPLMRDIVNRFGLVDLMLVEPRDDTIVYSTAKETDFGTSLDTGPYSGTPLARLVDRVTDEGRPGDVFVSDFTLYPPSLDAPAAFLGAPLYDGERLAGVVVAQIGADDINAIMSRDWRQGLLGDTGEVYLVGEDGLMRSDSRLFEEDRSEYLRRIDEVDEVDESDRDRMESLGTTILLQPIDSEAVDEAFAIDDGITETTSYLGQDVLTAYEPLNVEGLDWAILAEQERAELRAPVNDYRTEALILTAAFVAALAFLAMIWANALIAPVRAISRALGRVRDGDLTTEVPAHGAREFHQLAGDFNQMVADLRTRTEQVERAAADRRDLLRRLLPEPVARAVDAGDRTLLDTVPQASVAVIVIGGDLNALARESSAERSRAFVHRLIDELDHVGSMNGLERIKVVGDTYYAACGLSSAHLDHAPRTVAFALEARDAVRALAESSGLTLELSAGIHSGAVTVGLTGGSRLVYDLWGETVSVAHRLSRVAAPGEILVSAATRERLPDEVETVSLDAEVGDHAAWRVEVAHVTESGTGER